MTRRDTPTDPFAGIPAERLEANAAWKRALASVSRSAHIAVLETSSAQGLANALGVSRSLVNKWFAEGEASVEGEAPAEAIAHLPLAILAVARVPAALVARLVSETLALRAPRPTHSTREGSLAAVARVCAEALPELVEILLDGRVDDREHPRGNALVAKIHAATERHLREHPADRRAS